MVACLFFVVEFDFLELRSLRREERFWVKVVGEENVVLGLRFRDVFAFSVSLFVVFVFSGG